MCRLAHAAHPTFQQPSHAVADTNNAINNL